MPHLALFILQLAFCLLAEAYEPHLLLVHLIWKCFDLQYIKSVGCGSACLLIRGLVVTCLFWLHSYMYLIEVLSSEFIFSSWTALKYIATTSPEWKQPSIPNMVAPHFYPSKGEKYPTQYCDYLFFLRTYCMDSTYACWWEAREACWCLLLSVYLF